MRRARLAIPLALLGLTACILDSEDPFFRQTYSTSFESEFDWNPDGTDLDDPPVVWSVERSDVFAESGDWSVRFILENLNDAGKIWMERAFELQPGATYDIEIAFDFASADFGDINLWTIIAGASDRDPETRDDLTFQEDTGNGSDTDVGHIWLPKRYMFTRTADSAGLVHVALGVWGTSEFSRTYFIDDVEITFTER
ncbi:MAG TPA: hypothetical protein VM737_03090 [Gemmatimonadota bacterium]|nr:hypothetical protein [Gemmatimonadota bacterium]